MQIILIILNSVGLYTRLDTWSEFQNYTILIDAQKTLIGIQFATFYLDTEFHQGFRNLCKIVVSNPILIGLPRSHHVTDCKSRLSLILFRLIKKKTFN